MPVELINLDSTSHIPTRRRAVHIDTGLPRLLDLVARSRLLCLLPTRAGISVIKYHGPVFRNPRAHIPVQVARIVVILDLAVPRRLLYAALPLHRVGDLAL